MEEVSQSLNGDTAERKTVEETEETEERETVHQTQAKEGEYEAVNSNVCNEIKTTSRGGQS